MKRVILASGNKKKIRELSAILDRFGMSVITKDEAGFEDVDPEENGETYEENSMIKARAIQELSGDITIADDSGLEVFCLDGAPGIHSARYAGENGDENARNQKLIAALEGVPEEERGARFVTVITMLFPDGKEIVARGECPGHIGLAPAGEGGFGYDPLFIPDGYSETFAQLGVDVKNRISHRARALEELARQLGELDF